MSKNESDKYKSENVFADGKNTTTKEKFTQKMIEMINKLEKNKSLNLNNK